MQSAGLCDVWNLQRLRSGYRRRHIGLELPDGGDIIGGSLQPDFKRLLAVIEILVLQT